MSKKENIPDDTLCSTAEAEHVTGACVTVNASAASGAMQSASKSCNLYGNCIVVVSSVFGCASTRFNTGSLKASRLTKEAVTLETSNDVNRIDVKGRMLVVW